MVERRTFPHAARITRKAEYVHVFSRGEKLPGRAFICHVLTDAGLESRLGLVVSRKVGRAVVRNRIKRHIREFFRHNRSRLEPGSQVVVVARASSALLDGSGCARELEWSLRKRLRDA